MQIESIRKSTFLPLPPAPSRSTSGKRATTTAKSRTQQHVPTWPHTASSHPDLTPSTLSRAGYYYSPDSPTSTAEEEEEDDQCCCFTCGKKLGGWDTTDDPFVEHWKRSAAAVASGTSTGEIACAWATAVCSAVVHVRKWKQGSSADGGTSGKVKRGKTILLPANTQPRPHVYPRSEAHLHPRSELMNRAREQTYFPSGHLVQLQQKEEGREGKAGKGKEVKGWWPHKVKRAWLCTVPNLAKAGFVYTPTVEEDDCVTCFYCNYSVSDWEPVDDPWKQHYDKSPNCPFFTETVEGASDGNGQGDAVLGSVDASDEEARELPMTVRSKAAAGSKRPTSRSTSATTKARRATAVSAVPPPTVTKSTTRSGIPKTTARSEIDAPALSTTTSRDASDEEKEASDVQRELKAGKSRPKRATTTTVRASAKTTKTTTTSSTARKGTRRTTKAATAESGDDVPENAPTMAAEDEDTGVDELDALPRSTKSRVKASTRTATTTAKKPVVSRKPVGRAAKAKPAPESEMIVSHTTKVEQSVPSLPVDASDVEMASSHITASETEPSDTEKEDSPTDVEEQRREYLAEEETVKSHRMQMVEVGAREAMAVMQNLGSKRLDTVRALTRDESATPRPVSTKQDPSHPNMDEKLAGSSIVQNNTGDDSDDDEVIKLTPEEERLTVVEYVRRMYARRREALLGAGEAKIADWEEKAAQARAFIESIPTRN